MSDKDYKYDLTLGSISGLAGRNPYYQDNNKPTFTLFTGGQFAKEQFNIYKLGIAGNVPLGESGRTRLTAYGSIGNAVQGSLELSHEIPITGNLSFVGSAGTEGAFSFTDRFQYQNEFESGEQRKYHSLSGNFNDDASVISSETVIPYNLDITYEGHKPLHPDSITAITKDFIKLDTRVKGFTNSQNEITTNNNYLRGYARGELKYENGNFFAGAGVELRAESRVGVKNSNFTFDNLNVSTDNTSEVEYNSYYEQAEGEYNPNAANSESMHVWTLMHRYIDYNNTVDLNNVSFKGAQDTEIGLGKTTLSVLPTLRVGYRNDHFQATAGTDFQSFRVNFGANFEEPLTTSRGPHKLHRQMSNPYDSHMDVSLTALTKGGINAAMVAIGGHVAFDDNGTGMDAEIGIGNAVRGSLGFNKEFGINNNLAATAGFGVEGAVSLTQKDEYVSSLIVDKTLSDEQEIIAYLEPGGHPLYDWEILNDGHYTFNSNMNSEITNSITIPRHNAYAQAQAGIRYTNDRGNLNVGLNLTGGIHIKYEPQTMISNDLEMTHKNSYTAGFFQSSGYYIEWDDVVEGNAMLEMTGNIYNSENITSKIDFNQQVYIKTGFKPTIIPYTGFGLSGNYTIPGTSAGIGGQVGANVEFAKDNINIPAYGLVKLTLKVK